MQVGGAQLDHLIEFHLPGVDAMQQLNRDGNLEGAGHGESLVTVERHFAPGFKVHGACPDHAARNLGNAFDFALEPGKLWVGGKQRARQE